MAMQTWVSGRHFLEKELSKAISSRKTTNSICYQMINLTFQEINCGKSAPTIMSTIIFQHLNVLMRSVGDINEYDSCYFWWSTSTFKKSAWFSELLFFKWLCYKITIKRDALKVQDKPKKFKVTESKELTNITLIELRTKSIWSSPQF